MKKLAQRLAQIIPSASMAMAQKVITGEQNKEIIDLTWGQPDFDTFEHIKEAAFEAVRSGKNGYTNSSGIPELRQAISDFHASRYGAVYNPHAEIIVTPGVKQGLMYLIQAMVDPGDEVVLFEPCWLSYRDMILLNGGIPRFIPAGESLKPDVSGIEDFINEKTKAILINNPINPSGYVFSRSELEFIAEVAEKHDLYVIADEIYDRIVFTGFASLSVFQNLRERLVVANGFSKAYAMTGWRIGYLLGCERILSKVSLIHQHTATCAAAASQHAALAALKGDQRLIDEHVEIYRRRRDYLVEEFKESIFQIVPPDGTFYAMIKVPDFLRNVTNKSEYVLEHYGIATVDGLSYGQSARDYVRISFAAGMDKLEEAVRRFKKSDKPASVERLSFSDIKKPH